MQSKDQNSFIQGMKKVASVLFGKFENFEEVKKFSFLGVIFGSILATYWAFRPMKDGIFMSIIGEHYMPKAKMLSLVVVFPLVLIYSRLVDLFPRHKVFYGLVSFYAFVALLFFWGFMHPTIGLANDTIDPHRYIGWAWYVYVESFGSLIVALFWAIVTDITDPKVAQRGFYLIGLIGQFGNIVGPYFLRARKLGFAHSGPVVAICAGLMGLTLVLFYLFMRSVPRTQLRGYHVDNPVDEKKEKETEPGFFEGLRILASHTYLMGIFFIITAYETIITILDYHFKVTVKLGFPTEAARSDYLGIYGSMVGVIATLCIILGIGNIQRRLGMTISLALLPVLVGVAVLTIKCNPSSLLAGFIIMVSAKAINYALAQPTMKQLYIPTSKDAKYKSQAWIEMFGSRASKGVGSVINDMRPYLTRQYGAIQGIASFLTIASFISLGIIGLWFLVILHVASIYGKAIKENRIVC